ncbi:MAG TPA: dethiobiotin synthase [Candidatus Acidoferrum sp.]|nr:dethiobiotin synthase [Candidatus Acidoferrum sp.]
MPRIIVITGTDTGAGKTVLTCLLARYLRNKGVNVAALKPLCSGGRSDAQLLRRAADAGLKLDDVNPWHFRAPLAPAFAARREKRAVTVRDVSSHIWNIAHRFDVVLVEGAGGLLSPLGEHFSTRELISALGADLIIAAQNKLGVVNHVRLTLEALQPVVAARARLALMSPPRSDDASRSNVELLGEFMSPDRVAVLPRFRKANDFEHMVKQSSVRRAIDAVLH